MTNNHYNFAYWGPLLWHRTVEPSIV